MRHALRIVPVVMLVLSVAMTIRGRSYVAEVRHQEAQLKQVIADLAVPGTLRVRAPKPIPAGEIWAGWLLKPIPLIGTLVEVVWYPNGLRWVPGRSIHLGAVYRSNEPIDAIHAHYREQIQPVRDEPLHDGGYVLAAQRADLRVQIIITPREFLPDGTIDLPRPGAAPETLATAVEIRVFSLTAAEADQVRTYP